MKIPVLEVLFSVFLMFLIFAIFASYVEYNYGDGVFNSTIDKYGHLYSETFNCVNISQMAVSDLTVRGIPATTATGRFYNGTDWVPHMWVAVILQYEPQTGRMVTNNSNYVLSEINFKNITNLDVYVFRKS